MVELNRREMVVLLGTSGMASVTLKGAEDLHMKKESLPDDPQQRRELLYRLMGDLPDRNRPISATLVSREEREHFVLEKLQLDLNGIEPVPAYFIRPLNASGRLPTVLYNHSHGGGYKIGKDEILNGREYLQSPPYARVISELGWSALCIDSWVFGERSHTTELDMFKAMIWQGEVLWGMMVYDSLRAVDYLFSRPDVDTGRVATLGMSMGSTMAWWLAALDPRIKVTVDICCLTDFESLLKHNGQHGHGIYYYVPGLMKYFSTSQINALISPRPHLGIAGLQDTLTPVDGLDIIDANLKQVYARAGHPEHWKLLRYDCGHRETPEARNEIIQFLKTYV